MVNGTNERNSDGKITDGSSAVFFGMMKKFVYRESAVHHILERSQCFV